MEILLRHPDGLLRYVGDERGVNARLRVDNDAFDAPWVLRALAARGVLVGYDGEQPYCSAVLGDPERPLAVLVDPPAGAVGAVHPRRRPARRAARAARRSPGCRWPSCPPGTTRPSVAPRRTGRPTGCSATSVRRPCRRWPCCASPRTGCPGWPTRFEGPDAVGEIVSELYSVERAVASLLGAIALASETGPTGRKAITTGGASGPARRDAEWTTTGRLEDAVGP